MIFGRSRCGTSLPGWPYSWSIAAVIGAEVAKRGLRGHKMMKMSMADEAKIHFDPLQSVINPLAINPQRVRHLIN